VKPASPILCTVVEPRHLHSLSHWIEWYVYSLLSDWTYATEVGRSAICFHPLRPIYVNWPTWQNLCTVFLLRKNDTATSSASRVADSTAACDIPPLSKDGQSSPGSLRGVIIEVMTHNTSHTWFKYIKCSKSQTLLQNLEFQILITEF
jgi:hypothetical protein